MSVLCGFENFVHAPEWLACTWFVIPHRHHGDMAPSTRSQRDVLGQILEQQIDVITRKQALAAGLTAHALRHRLRAGVGGAGCFPASTSL